VKRRRVDRVSPRSCGTGAHAFMSLADSTGELHSASTTDQDTRTAISDPASSSSPLPIPRSQILPSNRIFQFSAAKTQSWNYSLSNVNVSKTCIVSPSPTSNQDSHNNNRSKQYWKTERSNSSSYSNRRLNIPTAHPQPRS